MRYAIVDIGSNTVKMHIYDAEEKKDFSHLTSYTVHAKLIKYIENGKMSDSGVDAICEIISDFQKKAKKLSCDKFFCFATASLRRAQNRDNVITSVKDRTGEKIDLISGEREAEYSFIGATNKLDISGKSGMLIDMGGGSTESVSYVDGKITQVRSMPFGSLSLFSDFVSGLFPSEKEAEKITEYVTNIVGHNSKCEELLVVGGTGEAICSLHCAVEKNIRNGAYRISVDDLYKMINTICKSEKSQALLRKTAPEREQTLCPGGYAIYAAAKATGAHSLTFLHGGIREGYLLSII